MAPSLVIDDNNTLLRAALEEALGRHIPGARVVEVPSLDRLQRALEEHADADLIVLDLKLRGARIFSAVLYVKAANAAVPVVVVSASEDANVVQQAIDFGAFGFVSKAANVGGAGRLQRSFHRANGWETPAYRTVRIRGRDREFLRKLPALTPRQVRVLVMLAEGHSNRRIADNLAITEATVKAHITGILRKLGTVSRTETAVLAQRLLHAGELTLPDALDGIPSD